MHCVVVVFLLLIYLKSVFCFMFEVVHGDMANGVCRLSSGLNY